MLGSLSFLSVGLVFVVVNQINCRSNQPSTKALKVAFVILSFAGKLSYVGVPASLVRRKSTGTDVFTNASYACFSILFE